MRPLPFVRAIRPPAQRRHRLMRLVLVAPLVALACAASPQPAPQAGAPEPASRDSLGQPEPVSKDSVDEPAAAPVAAAGPAAGPVQKTTSEPSSPDLDAATLATLARGANGKIQGLIHPKLGVYLVHNMSGSVPHLVHLRRWPKEDGWWLEPRFDSEGILADLAAAETWTGSYRPPLTEGECDKGSSQLRAGTSGALSDVLDVHLGLRDVMEGEEEMPPWLQRSYKEIEREGFQGGTSLSLDAATWHKLQRLGAAASHHAFLEYHGVVEFGHIDGRWYLLGIDNTDDACG